MLIPILLKLSLILYKFLKVLLFTQLLLGRQKNVWLKLHTAAGTALARVWESASVNPIIMGNIEWTLAIHIVLAKPNLALVWKCSTTILAVWSPLDYQSQENSFP